MGLIHTHTYTQCECSSSSSIPVMFWLCSTTFGNFNIHSNVVLSESSLVFFPAHIVLKRCLNKMCCLRHEQIILKYSQISSFSLRYIDGCVLCRMLSNKRR